MDRRIFLGFTGTAALGCFAMGGWIWYQRRKQTGVTVPSPQPNSELSADVVILGGGLGGCAAALACARHGQHVILTEPTSWLGGQLTAQAVPPDEHAWIEESFGSTRSYQKLRDGIRAAYRADGGLTENARAIRRLNPGNGWVSRLCVEPVVAERVLREQLSKYVDSGLIRVLYLTTLLAADCDGDKIRCVTVQGGDGAQLQLLGKYFLDATEEGDLLPLVNCEHVTGSESRGKTGEINASVQDQPRNIQAFTVCAALEYREGEKHVITQPDSYAFWRDYVPKLTPPYKGKLFSWDAPTEGGTPFFFDPVRGNNRDQRLALNLWTYRRIRDHRQFLRSRGRGDISIVNWHLNDYLLGPLHGVEAAEAKENLRKARELTLSLVYWLQVAAPRPDGNTGWPELRLCPDVMGTEDGLAMAPYIRESRRIKAEFTILERHVSKPLREKRRKDGEPIQAEPFADSVGIGSYPLDLHPTCGGDNSKSWPTLPFRIPLGALIPVRLTNLLPACKNIGTTHLTNGCYRLHPVEWNIGEVAGLLVVHALRQSLLPRQIAAKPQHVETFQNFLREEGIPLEWPEVVIAETGK